MSVQLADIIDVLDAAYPPRLAQDWDSVGLVCGDPAETVESVTIAVDATAAVVAEVPDRGLLLAHHPLLLRGVDTVAASTAKGALVHQLIRTGRALFTAHTNADAASPGVSDALADALGLTVEEVLAPISVGADLDKWVIFVPAENADAVREAMFAAGAGHIGDYSHCSWSVSGTGQFLPQDGASPTIGSVGTVERVPEDRVEVDRADAPARACAGRDAGGAPLRGARIRRLRVGRGARRCGVGPSRCAAETGAVVRLCIPRHDALPGTSWGVRAVGRFGGGGVAGRGMRGSGRLACSTRSRARACRPTSPPICATIPPTSTGARPMWRWSTSLIGPVNSRGVPRRPICCGAISATRCRCGCPLSAPIPGMSRETDMKAEVVQQRSLLELAELDAELEPPRSPGQAPARAAAAGRCAVGAP